jgi:peroxiredoxin
VDQERRTAYLGVGDRMPDVRLPRLGGGAFAFASLRGRFALLYLWASW